MTQLTFDGSIEPQKKEKKADSWYTGRTLSYSSVNLYQTCPQKWKFKYIDKIPEKPKSFFSFGKSVHSALEYLFSLFPNEVPSLDHVLLNYKENWIREGYESTTQEKWFFQEGERILKGFYAKHHTEFKNVFRVEFKFNFEINGVPITGYIDRIDETRDGKLSILDYKTGRAFDKSRARNEFQLTLYQLAVKNLFHKEVENVGLYHLNSLTPLYVPAHSKIMEDKISQRVTESAQGINKKIFDPKPDASGHCQWCDYVQICPAFADRNPLADISRVNLKEDVDRLGEIEIKLNELTDEKEAIQKKILLQVKKDNKKNFEGNKFGVQLTDDDQISIKKKK